MLKIIGLKKVTYYRWLKRTGQPNRHNGKIPKSHWLTPEEVKKIEDYARDIIHLMIIISGMDTEGYPIRCLMKI